jgi:hypothetical protein
LNKNVSIITTTQYESIIDNRFHTACQTIGNACALQYNVTIVDASPDGRVWKAFHTLKISPHIQKHRGTKGLAQRQAFSEAPSSARVHIWTEPEKTDLIRHIPRLIDPVLRDNADIIVPKRSAKSLASYPAFQVKSELEANAVFAEVTGLELDVMFGPVVFADSQIRRFATCDPARYGATDTDIQQIALIEAIAEGKTVESVEIDFFYPSVQRAEEEEAKDTMIPKRRQQLEERRRNIRIVSEKLQLRESV